MIVTSFWLVFFHLLSSSFSDLCLRKFLIGWNGKLSLNVLIQWLFLMPIFFDIGNVASNLICKNKKELAKANSYPMRREGLEPSRPKAVTGSLVLRVCQFRHPRVDYFTSISTFKIFVNTFFRFFSFFQGNYSWISARFSSSNLAPRVFLKWPRANWRFSGQIEATAGLTISIW